MTDDHATDSVSLEKDKALPVKRILLVEDEKDNLEIMMQVLVRSSSNYEVLQALDCHTALEIARKDIPDLIITDWYMPDISGIDMIRELKKNKETGDIPVIVCTGVMTTSDNLETALKAGAVDYVRKPVEPVELIARVRAMLKLAESFQRIKEQNQQLKEKNELILRKQEELAHMATHDGLTGLPNRVLFIDRFEVALAVSRRNKSMTALLFIDLDGFKDINDAHGHETGDLLLQKVAQRLRKCIRQTDTVARLGGDEFLALVTDVKDNDIIRILAERIVNNLSQPFHVSDFETTISASIGIAVYPRDGVNARDIIKKADASMYEVKKSGKNAVRFCTLPDDTVMPEAK